jgi:esterase/lipase
VDLLGIMASAERKLPEIHCPVLLIQSHQDEIVHPLSMCRLQKGLVNANVCAMELTSSWHSYFPDQELSSIQARLITWLKNA